MGQPTYTHTSRDAQGTPTQVEHSQLQAATDPTDPAKDGTSGCHDKPQRILPIQPGMAQVPARPRSSQFLVSRQGTSLATASRLPLPRSGSGRRRVSCNIIRSPNCFFENNEFFSKPPGRPLWGSGGVSWGSGGPVGLEKLVDSLTRRISPTTKFGFGPVSLRSGPGMAKKSQGNHENFKKSQEIQEI